MQQSKYTYTFVEDQPEMHDDVQEMFSALTDRVNAKENTVLSRILIEVMELRKENKVLRSNIQQTENYISLMPRKPFESLEDFKNFEKELRTNDEMHALLVKELRQIKCISSDKFVRLCWRKIFVDELAEQFSWRGTATKETIRELSLTEAIRSAFRQKFSLSGEDFDRITQRFFQYAHDRLIKSKKYSNQESKKGETELST